LFAVPAVVVVATGDFAGASAVYQFSILTFACVLSVFFSTFFLSFFCSFLDFGLVELH